MNLYYDPRNMGRYVAAETRDAAIAAFNADWLEWNGEPDDDDDDSRGETHEYVGCCDADDHVLLPAHNLGHAIRGRYQPSPPGSCGFLLVSLGGEVSDWAEHLVPGAVVRVEV